MLQHASRIELAYMPSYAHIIDTWAVWWPPEVFWPGAGAINWFNGGKTLREYGAPNHAINGASTWPNHHRRPPYRYGMGVMGVCSYPSRAMVQIYGFHPDYMHLFKFGAYYRFVPVSTLYWIAFSRGKTEKNISTVACWNGSKRSGTIGGVFQTTYPRGF